MIIITTPLRTKFAMLEAEIQKILLKDIGFLTLETEYDQLRFVEKILELSKPQREFFTKKMKAKQKSRSYRLHAGQFKDQYEAKVMPFCKKAIKRGIALKETRDKETAEKKLKESLENT